MEKIVKCILVVFFSAVLFLPLIFINRDPNTISVIENKKVSAFPDLNEKSIFDRNTIAELETYFDENIGFRNKAVLTNISLLYKTFKKVEVPDYIVGKDKHLFYCPENILSEYQGTDILTNETVSVWAESYYSLNEHLKENGIDLYFFPIPNKEAVYSEYMPSSIKRINTDSALYQIVNAVSENAGVNVIDTRSSLMNAKKENVLLYYKNYDPTHWNFYGAYIGYKALMDEICKDHKEVVSITLDDSDFSREEVCSPIAYLSQYNEFAETFNSYSDVFYTIDYPFKGISDNSLPEGFSMANNTTNSYFHYRNDSLDYSKSIMIMGDSYIYSFMLPLLAESFSDVWFLSNSSAPNAAANELINMVSPDIIIYECVDRMFNYPQTIDKMNYLASEHFDVNMPNLQQYNDEALLRFDDGTILETGSVNISEIQSDSLILTGWAVDIQSNKPVPAVYAKVGEKVYISTNNQRPDLPPEHLDSGFAFEIPVEELEKNDTVSFYCVSSDKTAFFKPIDINIIK